MRDYNEFILADLIALRAEQKPDLDVLTFEHYSLDGGATPDEIRTYADLQRNGNRLAAELIRSGMRKGDRFAIMMCNHPEFVEAMIAASITGCVFVTIDPRTLGDKLAYMLHNSGCCGVICADYCAAQVAKVKDSCRGLEWMLVLESNELKAPPLSDFPGAGSLREVLSKPVETVDRVPVELNDPLQIIYTSGTTGDPKGIVGSVMRFGGTGMLGGIFGYGEDERPYTGLSFTHNNSQATALCPALMMGYRAVFSRRFTKSKLWDITRRYGCTSFSLLGGITTAIYAEPSRPDDADNPVRMVVSGGMPTAIWESFEQRFGVQVFEIYGASDGGGMAYKPVGEGPVGSFGKAMPGVDMRILGEDGSDCSPGVVGEICSRPDDGSKAAVEYFENPEASAKKIKDGWNRHGDMGHMDEDGWLFFDYRAGGGIRRNGDFVNPGYVEKAMAELDEIDDVFVYGVDAASGAPGEKDVVCAIVAKDPASFDSAEVFVACRAKVESNFVPSYLQLVAEIPKTASEKPQERVLLERFAPDGEGVYTE